MLISAVQQTNDLTAVHLGVNFSCRFTLQEVEERWHALLYSPQVSQLAIEAMKALHPGVVTMALNNALWSQEEEAVLARIPTTDPGHLEKFQAVLKENPAVFHTCRTATSLHHHWVLMGHNGLLNNQKVDLVPPEENIKEFVDAENRLEDNELMKPRDVREEALEQELAVSDRQAKMEILKLEEEIPLWRTVVDTGSPPDFGPSDYAILKGKVVEFRMTKRAVTLGRSTGSSEVDFDLSLEGPAFKISRRQASIQLTDSGEFMLHNDGRRPMYVSGRVIVSKASTKLLHNQIIEVVSMSFLVLLNTKLATSVKNSSHSSARH